MTSALEPMLTNLDRRERQGDDLPLALRRFRESMGVTSTISAMQLAVAGVLRGYAKLVPRPAAHMSAIALCRVCGVTLDGQLPRKVTQRPVYSAYPNVTTAAVRRGLIYQDPRHPRIHLSPDLDYATARIAVGHELGHFLIHRRGGTLDVETLRLPASQEEEALSEYAARLLLLPFRRSKEGDDAANLAVQSFRAAREADVTMYASVARLGDPDSPWRDGVRAVILWGMQPDARCCISAAERFVPQWHLSPSTLIPMKRCHGRQSLVAELGSIGEGTVSGARTEAVSIGALKGDFRVDAVAWGSARRGTRLALAVFRKPIVADHNVMLLRHTTEGVIPDTVRGQAR